MEEVLRDFYWVHCKRSTVHALQTKIRLRYKTLTCGIFQNLEHFSPIKRVIKTKYKHYNQLYVKLQD